MCLGFLCRSRDILFFFLSPHFSCLILQKNLNVEALFSTTCYFKRTYIANNYSKLKTWMSSDRKEKVSSTFSMRRVSESMAIYFKEAPDPVQRVDLTLFKRLNSLFDWKWLRQLHMCILGHGIWYRLSVYAKGIEFGKKWPWAIFALFINFHYYASTLLQNRIAMVWIWFVPAKIHSNCISVELLGDI